VVRRLPLALAAIALAALGAALGGNSKRVCGQPLPGAAGIRVQSAFRAEVFAAGLHQPTAMAYGPDGRLYVAQQSGEIVATRSGSCHPSRLLQGFETPLGVAWLGNRLYISSRGKVTSVLAVDPRGALLVADYGRGLIYRIQARDKR
jgi:glucose/arabinose dehydrogenase